MSSSDYLYPIEDEELVNLINDTEIDTSVKLP